MEMQYQEDKGAKSEEKINGYWEKRKPMWSSGVMDISKATLDWMKEDGNNCREKSEWGQREKFENC